MSRTKKSESKNYPLSMRAGSPSQIIANAKKHKIIAFDTEWDSKRGMDPNKANFRAHGASFSTPGGYTNYFTNPRDIKHILRTLIPVEGLEWVSHSATADWKAARLSSWIDGIDYPLLIADTMIGANLLFDNLQDNQLGIKNLVKVFFNYKMAEYVDSSEAGLDTEEFKDYAMDDAYWELKFYLKVVRPRLVEEKLFKYFLNVPAIAAFTDMEIVGLNPDPDKCLELIRVFSDRREQVKEDIWSRVGAFNLNSPKQLADIFLNVMKIPESLFPRTPTGGIKTGDDVLESLANKHPFIKQISHYRTAVRMISAYLSKGILEAGAERDGYIHPTYWMTSATGRTRSSGFNAQNIPGTFFSGPFEGIAVRDMFRAPEGYKLVAADASQGELRIMAHETRDAKLLNAYLDWNCNTCKEMGRSTEILHSCPSCGAEENDKILKENVPGFWHGVDLHTQTYENIKGLASRSEAKGANFGIVYGARGYRLNAEYPTMTVEEWDEAADSWLAFYSGVQRFHEKTKQRIHPSAMKPMENWNLFAKRMDSTMGIIIQDMFGRKRRIPRDALKGKDGKNMWKHILNQLLNFPAQAALSGWCQLAFTKFRREMVECNVWMDEVKPFAMIHDELIFYVKENIAAEVGDRLVWHIENASKMRVPMRSSLAIADTMGQLK